MIQAVNCSKGHRPTTRCEKSYMRGTLRKSTLRHTGQEGSSTAVTAE
jgi:hypothetical protein